MSEDKQVSRTLEAQGLAALFFSIYDSMKQRKFSKNTSLDTARELIFSFMSYKGQMDVIEQNEIPDGAILLFPEDPNNPMQPPPCNHG